MTNPNVFFGSLRRLWRFGVPLGLPVGVRKGELGEPSGVGVPGEPNIMGLLYPKLKPLLMLYVPLPPPLCRRIMSWARFLGGVEWFDMGGATCESVAALLAFCTEASSSAAAAKNSSNSSSGGSPSSPSAGTTSQSMSLNGVFGSLCPVRSQNAKGECQLWCDRQNSATSGVLT